MQGSLGDTGQGEEEQWSLQSTPLCMSTHGSDAEKACAKYTCMNATLMQKEYILHGFCA